MTFKGHTTFSGDAHFSEVLISGNGKNRPYIHIDIVYEGDAKDGGDIGVGFVLSGKEAYKVADAIGIHGKGKVFMTGRISTRTIKKGDKINAYTGIEVSIFAVSPPAGEEMTFIEGVNFLMFR